MLDTHVVNFLKSPLEKAAQILKRYHIKPDGVTLAGFFVGCVALVFIWQGSYRTGLVFILMNRIIDGLDGALARITRKTDAGGFLDICLDFIFTPG